MASYFSFVFAIVLLLAMRPAFGEKPFFSKPTKCSGTKKYKVTFNLRWTRARFGNTVPDGAGFSPLTAAAHMSRYSPFAEYSYATKEVEMVAESGDNKMLKEMLQKNPMVGNVAALSKPTSNNRPTSVVVTVDHDKSYTHISAIGMLAPTPDWVAFINNIEMCRRNLWLTGITGKLYGYDAGTEKTPGVNQVPQQNIYRLQAPKYPAYQRTPVGTYSIMEM